MYSVIVHYGELALKGRNRPWFISLLVRTIKAALKGLDVRDVRAVVGRIVITPGKGSEGEWPEIRARLSRLPGIGNFARAVHVVPDLQAIGDAILEALEGRDARSFRVTARRADKRFPIPSPDIEREIGRRIREATDWPVNLDRPDLHVRVEVLSNDAFFSFNKEPGTGGLPLASGGRVMVLLSGGIDSPVAAWRLIRRGCRAAFVHFHSYPILSRTSQEKARDLVRILTQHQLRSRLYLVPFGPIQQQIVVTVPPAMRVVVYRRLMIRIAERLAASAGAQALVTGDSLGQVASQTIPNLAAVGEVATMQIFRPLIGLHKEEIMADAQRIGTYETSIIPDEDCCTLFTPRYPTTGARPGQARLAETDLDVSALVERAITDAFVEDFSYPEVFPKAEPAPVTPVINLAASIERIIPGDD